ncbi:MAG TPA: DUF22 domain-containing protein [Methanotrichaceae archaeon]|nr:DUF22 domain-containing protein [Methanotrichaceae archaeon]
MPVITHRVKEIIEEIDERKREPFDFALKDTCRVDYLIAEEDKDFRSGDAKPVKIKKVAIPRNTILLISPYGRHGIGQVVSIGEKIAMPIELDRSADHALFVAGVDGSVNKEELIGVMMLIPIVPHRKG